MKKVLFISLAVVLALSVGLMGCGGENGGEAIPYKNDGMFIQETIGDIASLDPAWGYDTASGEQVSYIYEPLLFFDGGDTGTFVPVLATSWSFNDTTVQYRFTIREGVTFHNGNPLTPEDVEYSFERAMIIDRPGGPVWMFYGPLVGTGGWSGNFTEVDEAIEVDGNDVVFTLGGGAHWELPFLQILCGPWSSIVDKEYCIAEGGWDGTEGDVVNFNSPAAVGDTLLYNQSNGTGPWKFNLWEPGVQVKVEDFDGYWQGSVPFDWVITKVVDEWTNRKLSLQNGDADLVYVPRMYIGELEGIDDLTVYKDLPALSVDAFFFNQAIAGNSSYIGSGALDGNGIPPNFFTDLDVRKAFSYAFDFDTYLNDAIVGEGAQVGSPVIEGLSYYNPSASKYSLDLALAETHLNAAWGGAVATNGFKFTLLYNAGNVPRKTACEILAENLVGIDEKYQVAIQPISWPTFLGKIWGTMDMPMFQIGWQVDYPHADNFVVPFMHSTMGAFSAFIGYGSPALDAEIVAAFEETNPVTQQALYYELQQTWHDDPGGIMLFQPLGRRYFTKYISGFYFNPVIPGAPGPLYYMSKSES